MPAKDDVERIVESAMREAIARWGTFRPSDGHEILQPPIERLPAGYEPDKRAERITDWVGIALDGLDLLAGVLSG